MTLSEIKAEMALKTMFKIQEMKTRGVVLLEKQIDMCELCDQISQEIYDFAIHAVIQIVDRNHLRCSPSELLNLIEDDILVLTNGAIDVFVSASTDNYSGSAMANDTSGFCEKSCSLTRGLYEVSAPSFSWHNVEYNHIHHACNPVFASLRPFQLLLGWLRKGRDFLQLRRANAGSI